MKIKLKPQYKLKGTTLVSETSTRSLTRDQLETVSLLKDGLDAANVTAETFDSIEELNNLGLITFDDAEHYAIWELHGQNYKLSADQLAHITFSILDVTKNQLGERIKPLLLDGGLKESAEPRLKLLLADSYLDLPDVDIPALPVVCNRMRISIGPLVLPWKAHIRDLVKKNPIYLDSVNYELPQCFQRLQEGWLSTAIIQFVACTNLRVVNHTVEYNMLNNELKHWPIGFS